MGSLCRCQYFECQGQHRHIYTSFLNATTTSTSTYSSLAWRHLFHICDIRKMGEPVQTRDSSLKLMTWSVACMADGKGGFSHSSLYQFRQVGRLMLMLMGHRDPSTEVQDQKYAFKCYGQTIDDVGHVWLVNALAFSLVYVRSLFLHSVSLRSLNVMSTYSHLLARYNTFASAAQTVLSQSGTTNSKSDSDNIQNTPVQSPPSRSTATWCV